MKISLKTAITAAAIGDALGVPYEFQERGSFNCSDMIGMGTHQKPAGTWSDDTSMMIACCDSIRANDGQILPDDMRKCFMRWLKKGDYTVDGVFDCGNTVVNALKLGHGLAGYHDNGNGSLMRILPLAFTSASDEEIAQVSAITHAHLISIAACIFYVHVARALLQGDSIEAALSKTHVNLPEYARLPQLAMLPESEIASSGYVVHTLEAALWCLLHTDSFRSCVLKAVNLGLDTDTTACVAAGLAAIVYGPEGIPVEWQEKLRGKDEIARCLF